MSSAVWVWALAWAGPTLAAPAGSAHHFPGRGVSGVTQLCGPDPGYSCDTAGYAGQSTSWWGRRYGAGYASSNAYGYHNCTLYAAYRIAQNGAGDPGWNDNATGWDTMAWNHGTNVDQEAVQGAIAQWNGPAGSAGHVAYVEVVTDSYIEITDDNYGLNTTDRFRINRSSAAWPDNFLHFHDIPPPPPVSPPTLASAPAVSGGVVDGSVLTGNPGGWNANGENPSISTAWERCPSASSTSCTNVGGGSTYRAATADIGQYIRLYVHAQNSAGGNDAWSNAVGIAAGAPVNATLPAIAGVPAGGRSLTATQGNWFAAPTSFAFGWERCDASGGNCAMRSVTGNTYELTDADIGSTIRAVIFARNAVGTSTAASSATAVVAPPRPTNTSAPSVAGTPGAGHTLAAVAGTWTYSPSYAYQWQRCDSSGGSCVSVGSATSPTYELTGVDAYSTMRVIVTATNGGGSASATSGLTRRVAPPVPVAVLVPTVSGVAAVGHTLSAAVGSWSFAPTRYAFVWQRCDSTGNNCGARSVTSSTYEVADADIGSTIRVSVRATNETGDGTAISSPTALVATPAPDWRVPPSIAGKAAIGHTLSALAGSWNYATSFAYQWRRCDGSGTSCSAIPGASGPTYDVVAADAYDTLRIQVTAIDATASAVATSEPTGTVAPPAPESIAPPTIAGVAAPGHSLSAIVGTWTYSPTTYSYTWSRCDAAGTHCAARSITGSVYELTAADIRSTIKVTVVATNAGGSSAASSGATAVVVPPPPTDAQPPIVVGAAVGGHTLSARPGSWTNDPENYTWRWERCDLAGAACTTVIGAEAATYDVTNADAGSRLRVRVVATNAGGSGQAVSAVTAVTTSIAPSNVSAPQINGTLAVGHTLSARAGDWTQEVAAYSYRWQRCTPSDGCGNIVGATAPTYDLTPADLGRQIRLIVIATNPGGSSMAGSATSATVRSGLPENLTPPAIAGTALPGHTLSASNGTWMASPTTFTYRWQHCSETECANIADANAPTYEVTSADNGYGLRVVVVATNAMGSDQAGSDPTTVVRVIAPANLSPPTIAGLAAAGHTLEARSGTWTNDPTSISYQWQRCDGVGSNCTVAGSGLTYEVTAADGGATLRVVITASNVGGSALAASPVTATVPLVAPESLSAPSISGVPNVGRTLTASAGVWRGPHDAVSYLWLRCSGDGATCALISGATASTYDVGAADVGHALRVSVIAGNDAGATTATSAPTAVAALVPPGNTSEPTVAGRAATGHTLSASTGTWVNAPTVYEFQWQQCGSSPGSCSNVAGATSSTYEVTSADIGYSIRVIVVAANTAGTTSAASSSAEVALN